MINKKVGNGATVKNVSEATDKKQVPCAEGLEISLLIHTDRKREGAGGGRGRGNEGGGCFHYGAGSLNAQGAK